MLIYEVISIGERPFDDLGDLDVINVLVKRDTDSVADHLPVSLLCPFDVATFDVPLDHSVISCCLTNYCIVHFSLMFRGI